MKSLNKIIRKSGDTVPIQMTVTDSHGAQVPVTGSTFVLVVNGARDGTGTVIGQTFGSITSAPNSEIEFAVPPSIATAAPGEYWYIVKMTTADGKRGTIAEDQYVIERGIEPA